jgi:NaMN:DMB phosphoribosyltransferase
MSASARLAALAVVAGLVASCGSPQREPVPITPPSEVGKAPVARVPVTPTSPAPSRATAPATKLDPATFPTGAIYVCASGSGAERKLTAIAFDDKVGKLCRTHPEMGPCQYERNICRKSGGRVYAADGTEITLATEDDYDRKVMRVRFKSN